MSHGLSCTATTLAPVVVPTQAATEAPDASSSQSSNGVGIGVGIAVAIIVIVGIVLLYLFVIRPRMRAPRAGYGSRFV